MNIQRIFYSISILVILQFPTVSLAEVQGDHLQMAVNRERIEAEIQSSLQQGLIGEVYDYVLPANWAEDFQKSSFRAREIFPPGYADPLCGRKKFRARPQESRVSGRVNDARFYLDIDDEGRPVVRVDINVAEIQYTFHYKRRRKTRRWYNLFPPDCPGLPRKVKATVSDGNFTLSLTADYDIERGRFVIREGSDVVGNPPRNYEFEYRGKKFADPFEKLFLDRIIIDKVTDAFFDVANLQEDLMKWHKDATKTILDDFIDFVPRLGVEAQSDTQIQAGFSNALETTAHPYFSGRDTDNQLMIPGIRIQSDGPRERKCTARVQHNTPNGSVSIPPTLVEPVNFVLTNSRSAEAKPIADAYAGNNCPALVVEQVEALQVPGLEGEKGTLAYEFKPTKLELQDRLQSLAPNGDTGLDVLLEGDIEILLDTTSFSEQLHGKATFLTNFAEEDRVSITGAPSLGAPNVLDSTVVNIELDHDNQRTLSGPQLLAIRQTVQELLRTRFFLQDRQPVAFLQEDTDPKGFAFSSKYYGIELEPFDLKGQYNVGEGDNGDGQLAFGEHRGVVLATRLVDRKNGHILEGFEYSNERQALDPLSTINVETAYLSSGDQVLILTPVTTVDDDAEQYQWITQGDQGTFRDFELNGAIRSGTPIIIVGAIEAVQLAKESEYAARGEDGVSAHVLLLAPNDTAQIALRAKAGESVQGPCLSLASITAVYKGDTGPRRNSTRQVEFEWSVTNEAALNRDYNPLDGETPRFDLVRCGVDDDNHGDF